MAIAGFVMLNSTFCNGTVGSYEDLWVVVTWSLVLGFGLVTNILLAIAVMRNKKLRSSTSYWLIFSLSICDIGMVIVSGAMLLPSTYLHDRYMLNSEWWNAFGIFIYDAFWYSQVLHLMLMAINRYVNICRPAETYMAIFSRGKTAVQITLVHISGVAAALPGLFPCCHLLYDHCKYAAVYYTPTSYAYLDITINGVTILVMLYCYVSIIARVRRSRLVVMRYYRAIRRSIRKRHDEKDRHVKFFCARSPANTIRRKEMRLFFQFCTVSAIFLLSWTTWQGLTYTTSGSKWIGFVVTTLFFLNNCTNPSIYLIFNAALRKEMVDLLCFWQHVESNTMKTLAERTTFLIAFPTVSPGYRANFGQNEKTSSTKKQSSGSDDDDEIFIEDNRLSDRMVVLTPFTVPVATTCAAAVHNTQRLSSV